MLSKRFCLVCFLSLIGYARSSERPVILQLAITEHKTLTLREEENPCTVLQETCRNTSQETESYEDCVATVHPLLTRQLTAAWRHFSDRLAVDASFFTLCIPVEYDSVARYTAPRDREPVVQAMDDLLTILRNSSGEEASREFDVRRNDLRMTDEEQVELYMKAILLEPNHPLIVSQFGVTLLAVGREDLARALFSDAVNRGIWQNAMQRPVNYYIPGLKSQPWYDQDEFSFTKVLREAYADIKDELLEATNGSSLFGQEAENRNSYNFEGNWKTLFIKERYTYTDTAKKYFPRTIEWLEKCDQDFLLVKFSAVDPGTHIRPHTGPSNERLRSHFTLTHTGGARLRVGQEWRTWEEGKVMVFDSSWEHEVIHEGTERRVVLILDIWHPDYLTIKPD